MRSVFVLVAVALASAAKNEGTNREGSSREGTPIPLYKQADPPVNDRVADLLSRMTLQEKVNQLLHPWPDAMNATQLIAAYGSTGVGALYGYAVSFPGMTTGESLNYIQSYFLNNTRLGIPITMVSETLHSSVENGAAFPNPTLLASSYNLTLIKAIGNVIGLEARSAGMQRGFAPVLQVTTDPRFGRTEESFGEDPFLVAQMGVAMITGQQGTGGPSTYLEDTAHVSCEAKHALAYGYSGRDWYRADVSDRTLLDVYARPWKYAINQGQLRGLMVTHSEVNGLPMHGNGIVLSGILRYLFGGSEMFFASDADDVHEIQAHGITTSNNASAIYALTAGLDQELVTTCYPSLVDSVQQGLVSESYVDAAVARLLREKFALHLFDGPQYYQVNTTTIASVLDAPPHRALARQAATEGIILLQNSVLATGSPNGPGTPVLPLTGLGTTITRVALVGPNAGCADGPASNDCPAANAYRGGYCSGGSHTVTLYEALSNITGLQVTFVTGADITDYNTSGIPAAVAAAAAAQVVIAVVGDTAAGFGKGSCAEGIDADTIDLPGSQLALLQALVTQAAATPLVVVGVHGRPFTLGAGPFSATGPNNALLDSIPALLAAWRPGEEGGNAIADILRGVANPSGRLTHNWVRNVGAIRGPANPYFQARGAPTSAYVTEPATPLFPFGWGLSYNTAQITAASVTGLPAPGSSLPPTAQVTITGTLSNTGPAGAVVLQAYYAQNAPTKYVRYSSQLVAFTKVPVPAGPVSNVPFSFTVNIADMEAYDPEAAQFVVYTGNYTLTLGMDSASGSAANPKAAWKWTVPVAGYDWARPTFPGSP